jgi:hypothetical protein
MEWSGSHRTVPEAGSQPGRAIRLFTLSGESAGVGESTGITAASEVIS